MKLLRLLSLRSLTARPMRVLLSTFGIVLGVAAIIAIGVTNQTALDSVTLLFESTSGKADLIVTSQEADGGGMPETTLQRIEKAPGVVAALPSLHAQTVLADSSRDDEIGLSFFGTNLGGLLLYGIDPIRDDQARDYKMAAGRFLSPDPLADEVVLVKSFAEENDLEVGKFVELVAAGGVEKLRIVGLMEKEGPGQLNNGAFGVLPLGTAQRLFDRGAEIDQIDLVMTPDLSGEKLESQRLSLAASLGASYSVVYPASQGRRMTQMLSNYQIGLNFLSAMALFVGAFLIYNAFSMTVVERTREFGMLRTLGMTRQQVVFQVLIEAVTMGVIGSLAGVGLGLLMARGLSRLMAIMLAQDIAVDQVPGGLVVMAVSVGVMVAVAAALLPALRAGRVSPLEALRARAQTHQGWMMRYGWIVGVTLLAAAGAGLVFNPFPDDPQFRFGSMMVFALFLGGALVIPVTVSAWERIARPGMGLLFGRVGQLGSRNIQRSRLRTTLTVAALMIGVAMIVVVWVMTDSFKGDLDEWLEGYIGGDIYVTSLVPIRENIVSRIEALPGVAAVAPVRYFEAEWRPAGQDWEKVNIMAFDPATYSRVTSFVFSQSTPDSLDKMSRGGYVFISSVIAEKYGLSLGDPLVLKTRLGETPFTVAAITVDFSNQGLVIDSSWRDMEHYFRLDGANTLLVKVAPGFSPDQVSDEMEARYGDQERLVIISNENLLGRISTLMSQAFRMFDVLALIAMLVGFMGITNTLTMNVMERTQEIGMLRAVGMTRGQVVRMILSEAALMGLIGGLMGLVFGVVLSRLFLSAMTSMSGYRLTYVLPVENILFALLIAFLTSQLAAFLPTLRASRIRILDAIQYE
jgi:putative ABC transport system permease protein